MLFLVIIKYDVGSKTMVIEEQYMKLAKELHDKYGVIDAHLDLAGEIYLRYKRGEKEVIKNHYLKHWKEAGIRLIVSSIYLEDTVIGNGAFEDTIGQIGALLEDIKTLPNEVVQVRTKEDLKKVWDEKKIGIILYMEGLDGIGDHLELLYPLYLLGVRGASLTWSRKNAMGTGCCKAGQYEEMPGGLTDCGKNAIKRMEELGMFLDISHLNNDGFADLQKTATRPFIATHSNAKKIHKNYRNLTDEQMEILANQGGIMGLNASKKIVGVTTKEEGLVKMCEHIEYEVFKIGADHVGFGTDLCDSYQEACEDCSFADEPGDCLSNHGELLKVSALLLQRGMKKEDLIKIISKNFYNYFGEMLPK